MPLGREVVLGSGGIVLDGTELPPPKKKGTTPIFGAYLLWPNGWMDHDATWYGGRHRPIRHCVRYGPAAPQRGTARQFSAHVYCGQTVANLSLLSTCILR